MESLPPKLEISEKISITGGGVEVSRPDHNLIDANQFLWLDLYTRLGGAEAEIVLSWNGSTETQRLDAGLRRYSRPYGGNGFTITNNGADTRDVIIMRPVS